MPGEIVHFESHYDRFRPTVVSRWKDNAGPGSGIWYDLGPHVADQALQLFGPPDSVFADLASCASCCTEARSSPSRRGDSRFTERPEATSRAGWTFRRIC